MILSPLHVSPLAFFLRRLVHFQFVSFLQLLGGGQNSFLNLAEIRLDQHIQHMLCQNARRVGVVKSIYQLLFPQSGHLPVFLFHSMRPIGSISLRAPFLAGFPATYGIPLPNENTATHSGCTASPFAVFMLELGKTAPIAGQFDMEKRDSLLY